MTQRALAGDWIAEDGDRIILVARAEEGRPHLSHEGGHPIEEPADGGPEGETELYRCFDAEWKLLYVGISLSAIGRLVEHRRQAKWFDRRIRHIEVEWFPTRVAALIAERTAIQTEAPEYNKAGRTAPNDGAAS